MRAEKSLQTPELLTFRAIYSIFLNEIILEERMSTQQHEQTFSRKYARYDVLGDEGLSGSTMSTHTGMRLASISQGGCSFYARSIPADFPRRILCYLAQKEGPSDKAVARVYAEMIYVRPLNSSFAEPEYQIGFRFEDEERSDVQKIITDLEGRAQKGELARL